MGTVAQTRIIKIGNSQGIRISKFLLEQAGLHGAVEIEAHDDQLIIRPTTRQARGGWEEAFQKMAARSDDHLIDTETHTQWDESEWEW